MPAGVMPCSLRQIAAYFLMFACLLPLHMQANTSVATNIAPGSLNRPLHPYCVR